MLKLKFQQKTFRESIFWDTKQRTKDEAKSFLRKKKMNAFEVKDVSIAQIA